MAKGHLFLSVLYVEEVPVDHAGMERSYHRGVHAPNDAPLHDSVTTERNTTGLLAFGSVLPARDYVGRMI
jgi:hypothetical protein